MSWSKAQQRTWIKSLGIIVVGFSLIACVPTGKVPQAEVEAQQGDATPIKQPYLLSDSQKQQLAHIKSLKLNLDETTQLEKESLVVEAAVLAEREHTYFVGREGAQLYQAADGLQALQTLHLKDRVVLESLPSDMDSVGMVQVAAVNKQSLQGYIPIGDLVKTPQSFIVHPYDEVNYDSIEKNANFSENPRIKVKALYVTQTSFASTKLDELIRIANETEINAFVIDVKDDYGNILFHSKTAEEICPAANGKSGVKDIQERMDKLKENHIYAIARIVTFRSPRYAVLYPDRVIAYKDNGGLYKQGDGLPWASAYDEELWAYDVNICKEAAQVGFNEIQFDYVRFPATGSKLDKVLDFKNTKDISKPLAIQRFLLYAKDELKSSPVYITADIFGWAATQLTDVEIGQHWEAISNVVDYIAPMMYPSHYGTNNFGLAVPDAHPYETIRASGEDALDRNANLYTPAVIRPWIQDFTATWVPGHISYGAKELREQITALEDLGIDEFMIWNPRNNYSVEGLKKEELQ